MLSPSDMKLLTITLHPRCQSQSVCLFFSHACVDTLSRHAENLASTLASVNMRKHSRPDIVHRVLREAEVDHESVAPPATLLLDPHRRHTCHHKIRATTAVVRVTCDCEDKSLRHASLSRA